MDKSISHTTNKSVLANTDRSSTSYEDNSFINPIEHYPLEIVDSQFNLSQEVQPLSSTSEDDLVEHVEVDLQAEIEILNEPFIIKHDEGLVHICHKNWSLSGAGENIAAVYKDLIKNASILLSAYSDIPKKELTKDAQEMVQFLKLTFGDGEE